MEKLFHGKLVSTRRIIYTPSAFAKENLFHVQEAGELTARKSHTSGRKHLVSYLFFIVAKGSGSLTYDGSEIPLNTGDCVFIDCSKPYFQHSSENLWTLKWVHFYGSNMQQIYEKYTSRGGKPVFSPEHLYPFLNILDDIYSISSSEDYIRDMRLSEKLSCLLTLLMQESWPADSAPDDGSKKHSLQLVKSYLEQHFREQITLDELAAKFYINKFYLTRIFKAQFGISIQSYLAEIRVTHAKHLLRFSGLSVQQVGGECGIGEPAYFSRVFKKIEGISPNEYKKQW